MISSIEAARIIDDSTEILGTENCPFEQAAGKVLREEVEADRPLPPCDLVMRDGIAVSFEAWKGGAREFSVKGVKYAGEPPGQLTDPSGCLEVMTGAPLPQGCDCVVPNECFTINDKRARVMDDFPAESGLYIRRQGSDYPQGATLLKPGLHLRAKEIAVAASCGKTSLMVSVEPRISLVSTGNELVDIDRPVAAHQTRRSNVPALRAALLNMGLGEPVCHHFADDVNELIENLGEVIEQSDLVVFSGGISAGKADHVPGILEKLGVKRYFHGVRQRPGKPLYYGKKEGAAAVFGLPGNPLSTLICFHRYVIPALEKMSGQIPRTESWAVLGETFIFEPAFTYFLPVQVETRRDGAAVARPRPPHNSGDFARIVETTGFIELPGEDQNEFQAGYAARYFSWV